MYTTDIDAYELKLKTKSISVITNTLSKLSIDLGADAPKVISELLKRKTIINLEDAIKEHLCLNISDVMASTISDQDKYNLINLMYLENCYGVNDVIEFYKIEPDSKSYQGYLNTDSIYILNTKILSRLSEMVIHHGLHKSENWDSSDILYLSNALRDIKDNLCSLHNKDLCKLMSIYECIDQVNSDKSELEPLEGLLYEIGNFLYGSNSKSIIDTARSLQICGDSSYWLQALPTEQTKYEPLPSI